MYSKTKQQQPTTERFRFNNMNDIKPKWWAWHKENPEVYELFKKFTMQVIATDRKKYSHWAIMNQIRWHTEIQTSGSKFKISNNYIAYYARLFAHDHPQYKSFFTLKQMKEDK